jgi:molybdate transport system ATP-binding protein
VARDSFTLSVDLTLQPGTVVAVLGPNGSGKSTLLRAIAGLQPLTTGAVAINGRTVDDSTAVFVQPRDRAVGVVFQDYALFPHLSVLENVAFGPRARGEGRTTSRDTARAVLARLGIEDLADRRPGAISGGQAQRVALARALATSPDVLLLDEPLGALDVETRETVRTDLEVRLAAFDGCTILVTHDPLDAMLLADRVIVLEGGRIAQDGTPTELAHRPATPYVAALMGVTLLRGTASDGVLALDGGGTLHVADHEVAGRVLTVIRPESLTLHRQEPEGSARNVWQGTVASLQPSHDRVRVLVDGSPSVVAAVTPGAVADLGLSKGTIVWLSLKAVDLEVYASPAH